MPTMKRPFALWPSPGRAGQRVRHADGDDPGVGARQEGVKRVTCSAREDAVEFSPSWDSLIRGRSPPQLPRRSPFFDD